MLADPASRVLAAGGDGILVEGGELARRTLDALPAGVEPILLGLDGAGALFAVDLDALDAPAAAAITRGGRTISLREAGAALARPRGRPRGLRRRAAELAPPPPPLRELRRADDDPRGGLLATLRRLPGGALPAHRPGRDHGRRARRARPAGPPRRLARGAVLGAGGLRVAGRVARGGGRARGSRGVGDRVPRADVRDLAAVAVPDLADARLRGALARRRAGGHRRRARGRPLVHAGGGASPRSAATATAGCACRRASRSRASCSNAGWPLLSGSGSRPGAQRAT